MLYQQFGAFNARNLWGALLGDVVNECTSRYFILLPSLCQDVSKTVEMLRSCDRKKTILYIFRWKTVYIVVVRVESDGCVEAISAGNNWTQKTRWTAADWSDRSTRRPDEQHSTGQ